MSEKNEKYKDFLEGHDDQIQKMDVVRSTPVSKETTLNVYDVVIFTDRYNRTNMHRIVDKEIKSSDELYLGNVNIDNEGLIEFIDNGSYFSTSSISYPSIEITFISDKDTFSYDFLFSYGGGYDNFDRSVVTTLVEGRYEHLVTLTKNTTRPVIMTVLHKGSNPIEEKISLIKIASSKGEVVVNGKSFTLAGDEYQSIHNVIYQYLTRGDKAPNDDGEWLVIDSIHAKVNKIIPKAGYIVSYLTSIPGIIMLVGLGLIIVAADVGLEYFNKKEASKNNINIYFSSKWNSCMYQLPGGGIEKAELVGQDRYGENIYKVQVDISKNNQIIFISEDGHYTEDISLENVNSGSGFYESEEGIKSFVHNENSN